MTNKRKVKQAQNILFSKKNHRDLLLETSELELANNTKEVNEAGSSIHSTTEEISAKSTNKKRGILLVSKLSANGCFVTVFTDIRGRIRGRYQDKEGKTSYAFFVKGINYSIDISNKDLLSWARNALQNHCYFTVSRGNIEVNIQIRGGFTWGGFFGAVFGGLQMLSGMAISLGTGGIAASVGRGLIGSGLSTLSYSLSAKDDEINALEYAKKFGEGFLSEAVTGGLGWAGGWLGKDRNVAVQATCLAAGYAAGGAVGQVVRSCINDKEKLTTATIASAAVSNVSFYGAHAGISAVGTSLGSPVITAAISPTLSGGVSGALEGAAKHLLTPAPQRTGTEESTLTESVVEGMATGALKGLGLTALGAVAQNPEVATGVGTALVTLGAISGVGAVCERLPITYYRDFQNARGSVSTSNNATIRRVAHLVPNTF